MTRTYTYANVEGLHRALRAVPREAAAALRDEAGGIAGDVASRAAARARSLGGVAALVAPTIRVGRDRVPKVLMGSARRLPPRDGRPRRGPRQTIGDVIWGAEFGSDRFTQFRPWRGNDTGAGYFLWPTVRAMSDEVMGRYGDALMRAVDRAAR